METPTPGFFGELIRRKVVKVLVSYVAVAWVLIQLADIGLESFDAPTYFMQAFMLFALLGVPIVIILSWALEVTPTGVRREGAVATGSVSSLRNAIAVLPFANMSSDAEIDHIADGLSDNIITACQKLLLIDVTSRNSTFVYKDQHVSVRDVASELDVAYVLEGSIQKQGNQIRVTAQLIDASDDSHMWADHFDRELENSFELQDELTTLIVSEVNAALPDDLAEEAPKPSKSLLVSVLNLPIVFIFSVVGVLLLAVVLATFTFLPGGESIPDATQDMAFELIGGAILLLSLVVLFGTYGWQKKSRATRTLAAQVPVIENHLLHHQLADAFDLADEIKSLLAPENYPVSWWDQFSANVTIKCDPVDARVFYRPYNGRNVPWRALGQAPIKDVRLPLGNLQLKIQRDGFQAQEFATSNPSFYLNNTAGEAPNVKGIEKTQVICLGREHKPEMVYVAECPLLLSLTGLPTIDDLQVAAFYIDKHPVSNVDFLQFVESGGYDNVDYWQHLPWPDGNNWQQMVKSFVDKTEQPGPADWELGRIPDGEQNLPVTGVSWFEAAAYAQFAGKRLPTAYEWARAALPFDAPMTSIPVAIMKYSNFMGKGKSEPGEFPGLSGSGAYDMFGNVREWAWNQAGEGRCNLGGCDSDLAYFAVFVNSEDPLLRDHQHGFRCVDADLPDQIQRDPIVQMERTYEGEQPVSDAVYQALIQPLLPASMPVNAEIEEELEKDGLNWRNYSIDTGYGERIPVTVVMPPDTSVPAPSLVMFPGMGAFLGSRGEDDIATMLASLDFVVSQLGCAIVVPYWSGAFERFDHGPFPSGKALWLERISHWVQEVSQTVSFIEDDPGLDGNRIGFLGASYGVINTTPVVALEHRFKTAILLSGNLMHHHMHSFADAINFYPRIQCPTLMINGRYDTIVSPNQDLLDLRYKLLGTPEDDKKQVVYDAGHWPFPQHLFKKEFAGWLEKYL